MFAIISPYLQGEVMAMELETKLDLLGDGAQFDVTAPGVSFSEALRRREEVLRHASGAIFLAQASGGGCLPIFKVLLSNECRNDCFYCACRSSAGCARQTFQPEELARTFIRMEERGLVQGLFLSSGVRDNPERTQEQMIDTVEILRRHHHYRGYIHLKILPGVSEAAIEAAASLADRVSVNLEAPRVAELARIAPDKHFRDELLRPLQYAAHLHEAGKVRSGLTTQFVVGGADDCDREYLTAAVWLYGKLSLRRVYYSAFRPMQGSPLEGVPPTPPLRQHRLYQADWLLRDYGFDFSELAFDPQGNMSLAADPKLAAAQCHPERFPIEVNRASREELLRVPGLGLRGVERILRARRQKSISSLPALQALGVRAQTARDFLTLNGHYSPSPEGKQLRFAY
jgi:predicted DNA-binding helix-hairpin-helix protein